MRHYLAVSAVLIAVFLALFAVAEAAGIPLLTDPTEQLTGSAPIAAAAIGLGLLIADVIIPVPSSIVMFTHGLVFGAIIGSLLSLVGALGAALVGFGIGRRGGALVQRLVPDAERQRADAMLAKWGLIAIVVTRPIPILAETMAILAGASRSLSWPRLALAATVGSIPAAVLYAVAGAYAADFVGLTLVFACVIALAVVVWVAERFGGKAPPASAAPVHPDAGVVR